MPVVRALFNSGDQAVATLETLRSGRFPTDQMRLIAGPDHATEFATSTPGANVSAGPTEPLISGLLDKHLSAERLNELEQRIEEGAVLLLAQDLDDDEAQRLSTSLREHGAQDVEIFAE
jgi:hypothetical protein